MVDWSFPTTTARVFTGATTLMYICIGLMLSDAIRFAKFDWSIITGQRARRWPQIPYIFSKVCYWAYIMTSLVFVLTSSEINRNDVLQAVEIQMGWITVSSSVLLACRAVCVFSGKAKKVVSVVLTLFTIALLAVWMVGVKDTKALWFPGSGQPWTDGACGFVSIDSQYAIKYVVTISFDLLVMILTIAGVVRMNGGSRIGSILIEQGILYFILAFIINGMVTGLTMAKLSPVMSLIGAIPAATVCVMCSTRLYVELAMEAQPKSGGVTSFSNVSSSATGERFARVFRKPYGSD